MTSSRCQSGKTNDILTHAIDNYDQKSWNYYQVLFMSHLIVHVWRLYQKIDVYISMNLFQTSKLEHLT
jgi:hypothetical protein